MTLKEQNERFRKALERIAREPRKSDEPDPDWWQLEKCRKIARSALALPTHPSPNSRTF